MTKVCTHGPGDAVVARPLRPIAADGHLELYKSTKKYDAAVGREQHGYPPEEELPI